MSPARQGTKWTQLKYHVSKSKKFKCHTRAIAGTISALLHTSRHNPKDQDSADGYKSVYEICFAMVKSVIDLCVSTYATTSRGALTPRAFSCMGSALPRSSRYIRCLRTGDLAGCADNELELERRRDAIQNLRIFVVLAPRIYCLPWAMASIET